MLEVICSMVILTSGISLLMWQMAMAVKRLEFNRCNWEQTHDLIQAAEFLLIHGNTRPLDSTLFIGGYKIEYCFTESDFKLEDPLLTRRMLKKLSIYLVENNEKIDELIMDIFVEGSANAD